jgi:glutamate formiminotransferase
MTIIECIPNISEGRRPEIIDEIAALVAGTPGVELLHRTSDVSHNRSVLTFVGDATSLTAAVVAMFDAALSRIDLRHHEGVHPRIGAIDVVPFVPIAGATMHQCVDLARAVAATVAARFDLPVFLYEEAAIQAGRRRLEDIRRGQFEGLTTKLQDPAWRPDFGPAIPHASAGATAIGARVPLIAYNINLATDRLEVAQAIAKAIRESSGGLPRVKALGVPLPDLGIVQVSMNLTDYRITPVHVVFDRVKSEAARHGVRIRESELIGLIPEAALVAAARHYLQIDGMTSDQILEANIRARLKGN